MHRRILLDRTINAIYTGISKGTIPLGPNKLEPKKRMCKKVIKLKYKDKKTAEKELIRRAIMGIPNKLTNLCKGKYSDYGLYSAIHRYKINMISVPAIFICMKKPIKVIKNNG